MASRYGVWNRGIAAYAASWHGGLEENLHIPFVIVFEHKSETPIGQFILLARDVSSPSVLNAAKRCNNIPLDHRQYHSSDCVLGRHPYSLCTHP